MTRMPARRFVTTSVAAQALNIGKNTLNRWAREGYVVPAFTTPGGQNRWDVEDLRRQLRVRPPGSWGTQDSE